MGKIPKKHAVLYASGIILTIFFLFLNVWAPPVLEENGESLLLDHRFMMRDILNPPSVSEDIVIVAIDEWSLDALGRWPWMRTVQAGLTGKILSGNPAALAIDIFYGEPETPESDAFLAGAIAEGRGKTVLAGAFAKKKIDMKEEPEFLFRSAINRITNQSRITSPTEVSSFISSIPAIYTAAPLGHVYSPPDIDGRLRWEHLYVKHRDEYYPSLSLMTAAVALSRGIDDITIDGGKGVSLAGIEIPTDASGRLRINYPGREGTFRYLPAFKVLRDDFNPAIFSGKIVLLGTSAIATYDAKVTPLSTNLPGVEKNAAVIDNIINGRFITEVPLVAESAVIILTGLLLTFTLSRIRAVPGIITSAAAIFLFGISNVCLFTYGDVHLNFLYPFRNLSAIALFSITFRYVSEEKRSREIQKIFSNYVSPKIIAELIENPGSLKLDGQRMEVSVLFSDLIGFTSFSEKREPEEVVSRLNEYLQEMTKIIFKWDGTLDKFIGDGIMAFWGAPARQPDHAALALGCALEMSEGLDRLQQKWRSEEQQVLDCGIGINTGIVLVGNVGSRGRKMDYTIIGSHVNLGSRVAALTREYDTRLLITESTRDKISAGIDGNRSADNELVEFDAVIVRGKERPVRVFGLKPNVLKTRASEAAPL